MSKKFEKLFPYIFIAVILMIIISEMTLYVPPLKENLSININFSEENGIYKIDTKIFSTYSANLNEIIYLSTNISKYKYIYFYFDKYYPMSFSNMVSWYGLSQWLQNEAIFRGLNLTVIILNATQLKFFLMDINNASNELLIMASGVLPSSVFGKNYNLLRPWIFNGGTLIWIGDVIGYYSGQANQTLKYPSPENPGWPGVSEFLNLSLFKAGNSTNYSDSLISSAFDISYSYWLGGYDFNIYQVLNENGKVIGKISNNATNIALIPLGKGRIIDFGGPLNNENMVAKDILNIIQSNLIYECQILNFSKINIQSNQNLKFFNNIVVPNIYSKENLYLCVFFVQTDYLGYFAKSQYIQIENVIN